MRKIDQSHVTAGLMCMSVVPLSEKCRISIAFFIAENNTRKQRIGNFDDKRMNIGELVVYRPAAVSHFFHLYNDRFQGFFSAPFQYN